ncbi:hypothetical protein L6164_028466 [Bauhinia variegata]|uniref:Uncharacterized protein n=1 Tax=Bauhinia variegata TaxID=167791 RepID=A0ACB9L6L4_BAUVA|nr:hypothetical protein L6164_028466 [Bauhinia variegata]
MVRILYDPEMPRSEFCRLGRVEALIGPMQVASSYSQGYAQTIAVCLVALQHKTYVPNATEIRNSMTTKQIIFSKLVLNRNLASMPLMISEPSSSPKLVVVLAVHLL